MDFELPDSGYAYAVVRCCDRTVVAKLDSLPCCERAIMYRSASVLTFMPLRNDEIVGNSVMFAQMLERAEYRICDIKNVGATQA